MSDVNPINYQIRLEPDLERNTFSGSTEILIEAPSPVKKISLNALELAIWSCKIKAPPPPSPPPSTEQRGTVPGDHGGEILTDCPFTVDPRKEEMTISLPEKMDGTIALRIDYVGEINDKMAGFYRSKYTKEGIIKTIAVTQFQESDARRAFPCFDHPIKKATFDIEIIIDENLSAISNGKIIEEKKLDHGKKSIKFEQTPKMSTYLVFFGVGEFEFNQDTDDRRVRVVTMPGMSVYGNFGLEFGRKSLEFCEDYYGIKYPLPKLDLIAVPDFAFGAMENWGAMTFRENLLLHYPGITSSSGEERICEVIAHETAHQWFGNLVTPSDWKYLWLNESFATYFGYRVVSHYYPMWDIWDQFLNSQTDAAIERDSLHETIPIEIPGGEHVAINVSTAPIIYNKGGSVLRQIEGYIGKDNFKEGLRHYLKRHQYACAASLDLWEAFEEVSDKPITRIMKSWVEQPGLPIVDVKRKEDTLILTQKRFTYLPNRSKQKWLIPISAKIYYANGDSKVLSTLLDSKHTEMGIGEGAIAYKINYGQTGFYRVRYLEKKNLSELGERVLRKDLPPEDRWGLQNDLYALVRKGNVSIDNYLNFLSNYKEEGAFLPTRSISGNLFHAYLVMKGALREKIASSGKSFLDRVLASIGYEPRTDEKHTTSTLRDQIIFNAVVYGSKDVEVFAVKTFSLLMNGKSIHPNILKSVMQIGALLGNDKTFDWLDRRLKSCESEHERMNILTALGSFRERPLIEKTLQYALDKVPNRNKFIPISQMAVNPYAMPYMWDWYTSNIERLEQLHPLHYERVISVIVPYCGIGKEDQIADFFEKYVKEKGKHKDVISLSLENLKINSRWYKKASSTKR
jgi:tricorn protease interacting factor F2/3